MTSTDRQPVLLPSELVEAVARQHVHNLCDAFPGEHKRLANLLWVARHFHRPVKQKLFHHVRIVHKFCVYNGPIDRQHTSTPQGLARLLAVLQGHPANAEYTRELTLQIDSPPNEGNAPHGLIHLGLADILLFFARDCKIETLNLRGTSPEAHLLLIGKPAVTLLKSIRCSPSLRSFYLFGLHSVPRLLITGIPSEDRVTTMDIEIDDGEAIWNPHETDYIYPYVSVQTPLFPLREQDEILEDLERRVKQQPQVHPFHNLRRLVIQNPCFFPFTVCCSADESRWILEENDDAADKWEEFTPTDDFMLPSLKVLSIGERIRTPLFDDGLDPDEEDDLNLYEAGLLLDRAPNLEVLDIFLDDFPGSEGTLFACVFVIFKAEVTHGNDIRRPVLIAL